MPRVNINISDELKAYFEELSKETGASQSALMALALKEYHDQKKVIKELPQVLNMLVELDNKFDRLGK